MRPGEILPADAPAPRAARGRTATIAIRNAGRFDAYLTSHVRLERASAALEFDRDAVAGARPLLPAGASTRVGAGETVEVEVTWS
ncbi:urease subunit beta [Baekduia soli]|uniref:Urease subunit beta n=1 Tax=Baekduia soli TaxID=496014 RepID=A0A5B8U2Y1_9ACTN|nr:urease subunit beta [Baekduia soli]QEC47407.1 urease subunit beta [Baekduia soli]